MGNCSGFFGDRLTAAREMLEGGPIDVLTGDYLAELTMLILWKTRERRGDGYAHSFLRQMEDVLGLALERRVKIVANAGGLDPAALAGRLRELAARLGLDARVAHVEGDDILPRLDELQRAGCRFEHLESGRPLADLGRVAVTANAYLGAWGIAEALHRGADIVVCPRVTDASLVVGPAAWHFGWARDAWDELAGATVAGHVLECGTHATGGNYAFFQEIADLRHPGFPVAEIHADGSSVITKHPGTGGLVSIGTVTAQLLYEIDSPRYVGPDVVARFDSIRLEQGGPDRVRIADVTGEPPPPTLKVAVNYVGGYRNSMTFGLTGLDIEAKAKLAEQGLRDRLDHSRFDEVDVRLLCGDGPGAPANEEVSAYLRVTVKSQDEEVAGRAFSDAVVELALASYPGFYTTTPPTRATSFGVYWPTLIAVEAVEHVVVTHDGERIRVDPTPSSSLRPRPDDGSTSNLPAPPDGPSRRLPLGVAFGARSGDKGGNANVGVWAGSASGYSWLARYLTADRFKQLVPEAVDLEVRRFELPNLLALNFVVIGLLGEGVAASSRPDPQAKSLGESLRSRLVDLPLDLVGETAAGGVAA